MVVVSLCPGLCKGIQVLDVGWNCFTAPELKFLGELASKNHNLQQLGLANCAASSQKNSSISPCVFFIDAQANYFLGKSKSTLNVDHHATTPNYKQL